MENLPTPHRPAPPHKTRSDGWTPERQRLFLAALADCGSVTEAARRAEMTKQSAYQLRRHPEAVAFRQSWDAALVDAWRRVEETAIERVVNGEIEVFEKDGVQIIRHRPCAPHLVVHMLDRAEKMIARAHARDNAVVAQEQVARMEYIRLHIRTLAADPEDREEAMARFKQVPRPPKEIDGETRALRRLHDSTRKLPDLSARLARDAKTARKRKVGKLMRSTAVVPAPG